jgi:hypothetical protein
VLCNSFPKKSLSGLGFICKTLFKLANEVKSPYTFKHSDNELYVLFALFKKSVLTLNIINLLTLLMEIHFVFCSVGTLNI